jgi:hypothetical protein
LDCAKKLKDSFAKVGAYSSEQKFIRGDPEGIIELIGEEDEAFDEIHSDRGEAREEAKGAEEAVEHARHIGILIGSLLQHFFWLWINKLLLL